MFFRIRFDKTVETIDIKFAQHRLSIGNECDGNRDKMKKVNHLNAIQCHSNCINFLTTSSESFSPHILHYVKKLASGKVEKSMLFIAYGFVSTSTECLQIVLSKEDCKSKVAILLQYHNKINKGSRIRVSKPSLP